jgi:hypothetical protein
MKPPLPRWIVAPLPRFYDSTIHRFHSFAILPTLILCALIFSLRAHAQFSPVGLNLTRSVSGQFVVMGIAAPSRLSQSPASAADTNLVRLQPALLSVSAERIKESLGRELEIKPDSPWRGKIFLALHPAQSLDEPVTIVSRPAAKGWEYQVQLPDILPQTRFARALTGVLLLEFANRNARDHSAEIPAWFIDGLSQKLLADDLVEMVLSSPDKIVNGLPQNRKVETQQRWDTFAAARRVLQNNSALTFGQLSWPNDAQLDGDDGGVYRASAQVFVGALLDLKNGPDQLRAMLADLPNCYNWQTAFQNAFAENFPRPLDLEKWWALQVVNFAARAAGPRWTPAISREQLDAILSVSVEIRSASNALPEHAEISLQAVLRNFDPLQQAAIFQTKLRDLEITQFRMAPSLAVLADGYRQTLAGFLGERKFAATSPLRTGRAPAASQKTGPRATLKKLDELDAQRRLAESNVKPDVFEPERF